MSQSTTLIEFPHNADPINLATQAVLKVTNYQSPLKKIDNLYLLIHTEEIKFLVKKPSDKENSSPGGFTGKFYEISGRKYQFFRNSSR